MSAKVWLKERFPIDYEKFIEINEHIFLKEPIPMHMKKWWYCSGAMPLIFFMFQVVLIRLSIMKSLKYLLYKVLLPIQLQ